MIGNSPSPAQVLLFALQDLLVPAMLIGILAWTLHLAGATAKSSGGMRGKNSPLNERRGINAFWLGIMIGVLVIVISLLTHPVSRVIFSVNQPFSVDTSGLAGNVIVGLALGLGTMAISRLLTQTLAVMLLVTLLSAGTLIALFEWVVAAGAREQLLILSLSFIIGTIGYAVYGPEPKKL